MKASTTPALPIADSIQVLLAFAADYQGDVHDQATAALEDATAAWNDLQDVRAWRGDLPDGPEGMVLAHAAMALMETLQERVRAALADLAQIRHDWDAELRQWATDTFRTGHPDGYSVVVRDFIADMGYAASARDAGRTGQTDALTALHQQWTHPTQKGAA